MKNLVEGLRRFVHTVHARERDLFEKLARGQSPEALLIACSDSRVSPSLITQARPGQVFISRNAGNIVPPYGAAHGGESATIEYALEVLKVRDIIVCGHSSCGAMHAVLEPPPAGKLPEVTQWLRFAAPVKRIVEDEGTERPIAERLKRAVEVNVLVQLGNLRTHPSVAAAVAREAVELHGWVYDIATGIVTAYNADNGVFEPLNRPEETAPVDLAELAHAAVCA